ncbi:hypothetical protein H1C71_032536 [Ictidomys tridecemlineatus]|nr:hypothetical protein H1C71_032536 [Ictidomys tridecemlineatus]
MVLLFVFPKAPTPPDLSVTFSKDSGTSVVFHLETPQSLVPPCSDLGRLLSSLLQDCGQELFSLLFLYPVAFSGLLYSYLAEVGPLVTAAENMHSVVTTRQKN